MITPEHHSFSYHVSPLQPAGQELAGRVRSVLHLLQRVLISRPVLLGSGAVLLLITTSYLVFSLWPRNVAFSYGGHTCFTNPVVLPGLVSKKTSTSYRAEPQTGLAIAGYPVYSHRTCVTPVGAPTANGSETIPYGNAIFSKKLRIAAGSLPVLQHKSLPNRPVPTHLPLTFELDKRDTIFEYQLRANNNTADCKTQGTKVTCDVPSLNLAQSAPYELKLERRFDGKPAGTLMQQVVTTVEAVQITASSIIANQIVHDIPSDIILTLNKEATSYESVRLVSGDKLADTTATLEGNTLKVHFNNALARDTSYQLIVEEIVAADGGYLAAPFSLPFKMSGGPKVLSASIGSSKVQPTASVTITFDSPVSSSQSLGEFIKLEVSGSAVSASVSVQGNKVTLKPNGALARCTPFTLKVLNGLKNEYGVGGGSAWSFKSRVLCQTVFSIGTSVQGRSITAYRFGSGDSKVIFVGGTHGDEKSSVYLLNAWVDALEANPDRIPAGRTIVIIPNLNPDGFAASRRTNANNVDLNRNFPANDWKQGVTMPGGAYNPNGGGSAPLSEPESKALADYVLSQGPRLVLTYHAAAGVVIPNDSGDSDALAHAYDQKSNVGYEPNSSTGAIFEYDTTGAFENWLHDKPGITALLVELWTKSGNEYAKHTNALWHMAGL